MKKLFLLLILLPLLVRSQDYSGHNGIPGYSTIRSLPADSFLRIDETVGYIITMPPSGKIQVRTAIQKDSVFRHWYYYTAPPPVAPDGSVYAIAMPTELKKTESKKRFKIDVGWGRPVSLNKWFIFVPVNDHE